MFEKRGSKHSTKEESRARHKAAVQFRDARQGVLPLADVVQRKGSHNKKQMLKIKSYVTRNTQTNATTTHTVNEDFDLGFIRGHPQQFTDWDDCAHNKVQTEYDLGGETLVSVDYSTFSKR